jgi:hypothetical protein
MRNYRVLENDIDVNEIFAFAQPAGFTRLSLKAICDREMSLDEHNVVFGAGDQEPLKSDVWNETHNAMHNRAIFFLHKGPCDETAAVTSAWRTASRSAGEPLRVSLSFTNTGDAHWLNTNSEIFGIVRVGTHEYDSGGRLISVDFSRHDLPVPVEPGQTVHMTIAVRLPGPGANRLTLDLVAEGVTWFENVGSKPVDVTQA